METLMDHPKGYEKNNENKMAQENNVTDSGTGFNKDTGNSNGFNACTESDSSHYSIGGDNGL
jgi:hypothetical protein